MELFYSQSFSMKDGEIFVEKNVNSFIPMYSLTPVELDQLNYQQGIARRKDMIPPMVP